MVNIFKFVGLWLIVMNLSYVDAWLAEEYPPGLRIGECQVNYLGVYMAKTDRGQRLAGCGASDRVENRPLSC